MSRTNPRKKKKRQANKTLLVFGEGLGEKIFLRHLKKTYNFSSGVEVTIKKGKGGGAQNIIIDASKIFGAFDKRIVVFDNDKPKEEMKKARREAKKRKIRLIENKPCLEFLLLSIVDKKPTGKGSSWCKKKFESEYIEKKKRGESKDYDKLFPKKLLDSKRLEIVELNKLILIMEGRLN